MRRTTIAAVTAILIAIFTASASAYVFWGTWQSGPIVMHLQLGPSPRTLDDGCSDWAAAATNALATWNLYIDRAHFELVRESVPPSTFPNGANDVFWDDGIYGEAFEEGVLAVTIRWPYPSQNNAFAETDVVFNRGYQWNSYDGPVRWSDGSGVWDFQRVALHEFGHVLGLGHPDEAGQWVDAIMNSAISDRRDPSYDDVRGAYALYSMATLPGPPPPFPSRGETVDFRAQLEAKYADALRRGRTPSYADPEGAVVWTQEYLRYRLQQCRHDQASARVGLEVDGYGIQPVCGSATATLAFPPREETVRFRTELEALYRDRLGRNPTLTSVDIEGDAIWVSEYLRYRLGGCGHAAATERVMAQIDGGSVAQACR